MATKEDVAALEDRVVTQMANMEGRILDAFQQLIAVVVPLKQWSRLKSRKEIPTIMKAIILSCE